MKEFQEKTKIFGNIDKNDIYNSITQLSDKGLIKFYISKNSTKKYCKITKKGKAVLESSKSIMLDHIKEISKLLQEN
jgi:DNA-binding PadR family transcriptional regulator